MIIETRRGVYIVETTQGTEYVPACLVNDTLDSSNLSPLSDFVSGRPESFTYEPDKWCLRLIDYEYLDSTYWAGAFDTEEEAKSYIDNL
jgi:hypothetical protein